MAMSFFPLKTNLSLKENIKLFGVKKRKKGIVIDLAKNANSVYCENHFTKKNSSLLNTKRLFKYEFHPKIIFSFCVASVLQELTLSRSNVLPKFEQVSLIYPTKLTYIDCCRAPIGLMAQKPHYTNLIHA